jgi:DNA-binding response OmpR family regulator
LDVFKKKQYFEYKNQSIEAKDLLEKEPSTKRILIVDDDPDITFTFKKGIEYSSTDKDNNSSNRRIEVYTYNDPLVALSEFKPHHFDLLLVDVNLPNLNGFEFYEKILELDINVKACFMTAGQINREALREIHTSISLGCFIIKPVTIDYLVNRLKSELY